MITTSQEINENNRILIVDDNETIHGDYRKVLQSQKTEETDRYNALEEQLFGRQVSTASKIDFHLAFAFQGQEALELVKQSESGHQPFAMAFVDVRMPPGWDGVETVSQLWRVSPKLQVVICTAYSDYSWNELNDKLGQSDQLLVLRKPFQSVEVRQMALALTVKWNLTKKLETQLLELNSSLKTMSPVNEPSDDRLESVRQRMSDVERRVQEVLNTVRTHSSEVEN